jgi:hypothetical protein
MLRDEEGRKLSIAKKIIKINGQTLSLHLDFHHCHSLEVVYPQKFISWKLIPQCDYVERFWDL